MRRYNVSCKCGFDSDFEKLTDARKEAKKHICHNDDKKVYIIEVELLPEPFGDYITGKEWIIK